MLEGYMVDASYFSICLHVFQQLQAFLYALLVS